MIDEELPDDGPGDDDFLDEHRTVPERTVIDWYGADPVFRELEGQLGYVRVGHDINLAVDFFFGHHERLEARGLERQDSGYVEMQDFTVRRYLAHEAYLPLVGWLIEGVAVPDDVSLVRVRDALIDAGEVALLEHLYDGIRKKKVRRLIGRWHGHEIDRKRDPSLLPATEAFPDFPAKVIADWYDPVIALFERLGEADTVARWQEKRTWLLERRFLDRKPLPRPEKVTVDDDVFWQVLREVAESEPDPEARVDALQARLERHGAPAIRAFARRYERMGRELLHHDVWALVTLAYGTASMDTFFDFCEELFWRGEREVVEGIVSSPLSILDRLPPDGEIHGIATLEESIDRAAFARSGRPIEWREERDDWRGRPWETEELEARYPELVARLGSLDTSPWS